MRGVGGYDGIAPGQGRAWAVYGRNRLSRIVTWLTITLIGLILKLLIKLIVGSGVINSRRVNLFLMMGVLNLQVHNNE